MFSDTTHNILIFLQLYLNLIFGGRGSQVLSAFPKVKSLMACQIKAVQIWIGNNRLWVNPGKTSWLLVLGPSGYGNLLS